MIAIPTTAGTGSEVTIVAVIADAAAHRKFAVGSTRMVARTALLDAELTFGLPPFITAYTGMDALTHAIESYTSVAAQRVTDAINLDTISSIFSSLPTAVLRGDDRKAREDILYASCMASMTCNSNISRTGSCDCVACLRAVQCAARTCVCGAAACSNGI